MIKIIEIAAQLRAEYKLARSWEKVANHHGITKPLAWRMAIREYEPKRADIRRRLGLPVSANVVVMSGEIPFGAQAHHAERCTCGQYYISNHPRRRKCFICSPYRGKGNGRVVK